MAAGTARVQGITSARHPRTRSLRLLGAVAVAAIVCAAGSAANAAGTDDALGTAANYSVLAASTVTNTGSSVVSSDVGVSPGSAVVGFPPGLTLGAIHAADANAAQAKIDAQTAYTAEHLRTFTNTGQVDLGGLTLTPGAYDTGGAINLTGSVTLDAQGDPSAVFVFWSRSTLVTASASQVILANDAQACNVLWLVDSSATLGTSSQFTGTILANTSVTATTGVGVFGRAIALNGAVTLDTNTFTTEVCALPNPTPSDSSNGTGNGNPSALANTSGAQSGWPWMLLAAFFAIIAGTMAATARRREARHFRQ